jgi:hypothetical protein
MVSIVVAVWYVRCRLWLLGGRFCGVQTMPFYIYADSTLLAVALSFIKPVFPYHLDMTNYVYTFRHVYPVCNLMRMCVISHFMRPC